MHRRRGSSSSSEEEEEEKEEEKGDNDFFDDIAPILSDTACQGCWRSFILTFVGLLVVGVTVVMGLLSSALETTIYDAFFNVTSNVVALACGGSTKLDSCTSASSWFDRVVKY